MQTYSLATIISGVFIVFLVSYALQPQEDTTPRVAIITSAKPDLEIVNPNLELVESRTTAEGSEFGPEVVELRGANINEIAARLQSRLPENGSAVIAQAAGEAERVPSLPPEYDQFSPTVELGEETLISDLTFSTRIDEFDLIALNPERVFGEGSFTIYATFDYEDMADGMVWSWVWQRDGQVVSGGNELWSYGDEGPGYVYYNPREGFNAGEYTLEIWVNGELMSQANLFITTDIAAFR